MFTTREMCIIAVFAAACTALETVLGTAMKSVGMPFSSSVLVGLDLIFYITLKNSVKNKMAILAMSLVMAGALVISMGTIKLLPAVAIVVQGLIFQFFFRSRVTMYNLIPAVMLVELYNVFHPFLRGLYIGAGGLTLVVNVARRALESVGFNAGGLMMLILLYYLGRLIISIPLSLLSLKLSRTMVERLRSSGLTCRCNERKLSISDNNSQNSEKTR